MLRESGNFAAGRHTSINESARNTTARRQEPPPQRPPQHQPPPRTRLSAPNECSREGAWHDDGSRWWCPQTTSPRSSRGSLAASKRTAAHRRLLLCPSRASHNPTHRPKPPISCVSRNRAYLPLLVATREVIPFLNSHCFYTLALVTSCGSTRIFSCLPVKSFRLSKSS